MASKKVSQYVGYIDVAPYSNPAEFFRLGCTNDLNFLFNNAADSIVINSDSCGEVKKILQSESEINGTFYESFDVTVMNELLGGTVGSVAGTAITGATQDINATFEYGRFYELEGQNASGAAPTITGVVGSVDGALALTTDYLLVESSNKGTRYGVTLVSGGAITTTDQTITITYDYTPSVAETLTLDVGVVEAEELVVRVIAFDPTDENRARIIQLSRCTLESEYNLPFIDIINAGGLDATPFTFKAAKDSEVTVKNEIL